MPLDLSLRTAATKDALEYREKRFPVSNNCFIPIVGVTGSGKTTIIINLFRLLNEIYRYSHIIYVAANYRQDATLVVCILLEPSCGFLGVAPLPKKPQEGPSRGASPHEVLVCGFNGYTNYTTQHNCVIIVWKVE